MFFFFLYQFLFIFLFIIFYFILFFSRSTQIPGQFYFIANIADTVSTCQHNEICHGETSKCCETSAYLKWVRVGGDQPEQVKYVCRN